MNKDNWKGGLPPVGTECEAQIYPNNGEPEWHKCEVLKLNHDELHAVLVGNTLHWAKNLRPLKSEADKLRDEQIEKINFSCVTFHKEQFINRSIGDYLYDAGCRMTRELTDYGIQQLWEHQDWGVNEVEFTAIAKAIAAYVRGDSATGE